MSEIICSIREFTVWLSRNSNRHYIESGGSEFMKLALVILIIVVSVANSSVAIAADYVGNWNSFKFHFTWCQWAKKIAYKNRVELYSREEGLSLGMVPCKVCRP